MDKLYISLSDELTIVCCIYKCNVLCFCCILNIICMNNINFILEVLFSTTVTSVTMVLHVIFFTEITSLEKKDIEQANELIKLADEKLKLEQKQKQFESELSKLEPTKWVDIVQAERQAEAKIRSEILEFKSRTTKVGTELKSLQSKLTSLEKDITSEKEELKEEKEKNELEEKNLQDELYKVKSEIQVTTESTENDKEAINKFENELKEMNDELDRKKEEVEELEKELKDVNMKEFKQVTPMGGDKGKSHDSSGEGKLCSV